MRPSLTAKLKKQLKIKLCNNLIFRLFNGLFKKNIQKLLKYRIIGMDTLIF